MNLFQHFRGRVADILGNMVAAGTIPAGLDVSRVAVDPPRDSGHGDLATNAAMVLSKPAGMKPRDLAALLVPQLEALDGIETAEIAGPASSICAFRPASGATACAKSWARVRPTAIRRRGTVRRSMSNMSRPTQRGRCMSATRAARWSAMPWPGCWKRPGSR